MARTIWKFELELTDRQTVMMPPLANILSVQVQNDSIMLWATVDPDKGCTEERRITIVGTGNPMPEGIFRYVDTVQLHGFVWHIFEG